MPEPVPPKSGDTLFADPAEVRKGAVLSADGRYRYTLERRWGDGASVLFVMLNPSTADADLDDPTIKKCMKFARRWGYDAIDVWNIYALRATDPRYLDDAGDPIGHENENHLWAILQRTEPPALIVAAWGAKPNRGSYKARELMVLVGPLYDRPLHALRLTRDGHPWHPLYLPDATDPFLWHDVGQPR